METTIVRKNLMTDGSYRPYCGANNCKVGMLRTRWNGEQFYCSCGWVSEFPKEFIDRYKTKHGIK